MGRFPLRLAVAAGLLAALLLPDVARAGTSGSVGLTGTVSINCSLTVTPQSAATSMNLGTSAANLLVASINEKCQNPHGFTVTLTSNNGDQAGAATGLMKGGSGNSDSLAYTVKYGGATVSLVNGSAVVTSTNHKTGGSGDNKDLTVSYTGDPSLNADTYTDTIVLSLIGN